MSVELYDRWSGGFGTLAHTNDSRPTLSFLTCAVDLLYCPLFPLAWPSPASFAVVVVAADQLCTLYTAEFHSSLSIFIDTPTGLKNKMQHEKQARGRIEIKEERRACWCSCACSTKSCPPSFHHRCHLFFFS